MRALSITLLLAVWGCKNPDLEDGDGDGFNAAQDCNDADAGVHPDAEETCDGIDQDCDGRADEDLGEDYYTDDDGDGFGTGAPNRVCDVITGVATVGGDCDDADAAVNPDAAEDCDPAVDRNCDDDPVGNPADIQTWYLDDDLDGFGDATTTGTVSCDPPNGSYVADGTDCDDLDAAVHPGATEICDEKDTDCDPSTPEDSATDAATYYPDADRDGSGLSSGAFTACVQPADSALDGGDCDDANPYMFPGNNELCDGGIDNDCDPATDEALTAIWYHDRDNDTYGDDADTYTGCSPPAGYVQVGGDCDDTQAAINPSTTPNCEWDHCANGVNITQDEVWKANLTHLVNCDLAIQGLGSPTVTIEDGAVVSFGPGASMKVGDNNPGSLVVEGTSTGVTFTSSAKVKDFGDWDGVKIGAQDVSSSLVGLTVEYGGSQTFGAGLWIAGSDLEIDRLHSHHNLGSGLRISGNGAEPLVHDSQLSDNTGNGLTIETNAGLSRTTATGGNGPSFTDNLVTNNVGRPVSIPGSHADELSLTSTFSPNDVEEIELVTGTLRFTGTWYDHGIPYVVRDNDTVYVQDSAASFLTVQDGTVVQFGQGSGMEVGVLSQGRLEIENGPLGVVFSATPETIQLSSNWKGLLIGANDTGTKFRNALIEYGGARTGAAGNIAINNSAPEISDVIVRNSDHDGIYVSGNAAAPNIHDCSILDNDDNGVFVDSQSGVARSVSGPTFANNDLVGNGESSVFFPPDYVGELDTTTSFSGNGLRIRIHPGTVLQEYSLWRKLDEDYQVTGTINVGGPRNPVLEIEDRSVLYFEADVKLRAGVNDDGALQILGTHGVLMTSADQAPGLGDWHGVEIGRNEPVSDASVQSILRNVTIDYAGGSDFNPDQGYGALSLWERDPVCGGLEPIVVLENISIHHSSKFGFAATPSASVLVDGLTVDDASEGCIGMTGLTPPASCFVDVIAFDNFSCANSPEIGSFPVRSMDLLAPYTFNVPVRIRDTQVRDDTTLRDLGSPFIVERDLTVAWVSDPLFTVKSGVEVRFDAGASLIVATGSSNGSVRLEPNALLTSSNVASPNNNDWDGVTLSKWCGIVDMQGATLEYAGRNTYGAIYINQCAWDWAGSNAITANHIDYSGSCGIYLKPNSTTVPTGNLFTGNTGPNICFAP